MPGNYRLERAGLAPQMQQAEGVWKWMTGPEVGLPFWNGDVGGSAPAGIYANWNNGEPNNAGDEDYAHITDLSVTTHSWILE